MIIRTNANETFDTEKDLTAPERHILQKLILWESLASSMEEFRQKKRDALLKGWNNSGSIQEGVVLKKIISHLEEKVSHRLKNRQENHEAAPR
jgi:hypothetical protein